MKTFAALICASIALHGYFMPVMAANANDAADTASTQHTFHDEEVRHMKEDHHMDEDDYDQGK
jgi:hypothetical protein